MSASSSSTFSTSSSLSASEREEYEKYYSLILQCAIDAGEIIRRAYFERPHPAVHFSTKSNEIDVVTDTDKQCESLIIGRISSQFPAAKFIAEETHSNTSSDGMYPITDDLTFLIDPLDGTTNFIHQLPFVCVSIAVMKKKEFIVAVVHAPILHETFHAIKGGGAFLNYHISNPSSFVQTRRSLQCSAISELSQSVVITEFGYDRTEAGIALACGRLSSLLLARCQGIRSFGSCALNMCSVALGRAESYYEGRDGKYGPKPWDTAASSLIVREAGGIAADVTGKQFDLCSGRILAAANQKIFEQTVNAINDSQKAIAQLATVTHPPLPSSPNMLAELKASENVSDSSSSSKF